MEGVGVGVEMGEDKHYALMFLEYQIQRQSENLWKFSEWFDRIFKYLKVGTGRVSRVSIEHIINSKVRVSLQYKVLCRDSRQKNKEYLSTSLVGLKRSDGKITCNTTTRTLGY